ncbi:MAG: hypothetical protein JXA53_04845 [Bacteroidales bacterium]|nr:hypothetical protein [Bacteroidales bacterium]
MLGTLNQTITGNGSGVLGNLYVNKNIGTTKLEADINIVGNLRLIGSSSSINLTDRSLHLSQTSKIFSAVSGTATDFSSNKMLFTNGNSSDGGITFDHFANTSTRLFPLGVAGKYTPTNITVGSASITPGTITVRPVNRKVSLAQSNNILNYFWKINTTGLAGILPSSINIDCKYIDSDITTGNKDNYVPGFFQNSKWAFSPNRLDIDRPNTTIYYKNISEIDGLYTAGEPDAFTEIFTYYSRKDGDWISPNTWSTDPVLKWDGPAASTIPNGSAPVVIGNGSTKNHNVTISSDNQTAALLHINSGSVLDFGTTIGHTFWSVTSSSGVDKGHVRIGSSFFPGGDWGEFLGVNGGTIEFFNVTNNNYYIPNNNFPSANHNEYFNLIINANNPINNRQIILLDADLTIHNDFTKDGSKQSLFSANGQVIDIKGNMFVKDGPLRFNGYVGNTLIVRKDLIIDNGASLNINVGSTHKLELYGNIINNGVLDFNIGVATTFTGDENVTVSGNGATNRFYSIKVDKGSTKETTVDVQSTNFTLVDRFLSLVNGTFRLTSAVSIDLNKTTIFEIPETAALSANGGTINIGQNNNNSDVNLLGRLEVLNGAINVGQAIFNVNSDILIAATGKPEVIVRGGELNVQGQIRRPSSVSMGSLNYTQSGGLVNIYGRNDIGDITNRADLEILNSGSKFNMSAGRIIIHQPGNTTFGDLYLNPEISDVTGGEIQLGSNSALTDARRNFNVFVACDIFDLRISGSKTFSATLNTFPLTLHSLIIDMNSVFNANGIDVNISGNLENNNDDNGVGLNRGGYRVQTTNQTTRFFGSGNKEIKSTENNSTNFANLVIDNNGGVRTFVTKDICVNTDLTINSGILSNNTSNRIRLLGNVYNKSTHESSNGGFIEFEGSSQQTIDGNDFGIFGSIKLSNDNDVKAVNDFTVNGSVEFNKGSLVIDEYQLTLGTSASITGTTDVDHMIVTNGALRDMGISKLFSGNGTFTYPFGVAGKYTPATITATGVSSGGSIRVRPINFAHKSSDANSDNQLNYYWSVYKQGLTGASFSKVFTFNPSDVKGAIGNYKGAFYENYKWTKLNPFGVNALANTITFPSNTIIEAEYTAGEDANFVDKPILYSRTNIGDWDNPNSWSFTGHGGVSAGVIPDGNPVKIANGHTINVRSNNCYSYSVDVAAGGTIDFGNTNLHDIGFVSGGGKIKIKSTSSGYFVFPGGDFSVFMSTFGSTIEYYGNGTLPETRLYQNVIFASNPSESNTITLANNGFTVNGTITIQDRTTLENGNFSKRIIAKNNWVANGTGTFSPGFGEVYFDGTVSQNITVNSAQNFYDLIINNSNGVTINSNHITVLNNLSLTDGIVKTSSSSILKLANISPNAIIGGSISSYIDGPLQKNIAPGGYFYFPIGNGSRYANSLIFNSTNAVNEYWQAEYFNNNPDNAVPSMNHLSVKAPIEIVSNNEYWQIKSTNAASKAGIRLRWDNLSGVIPTVASERINKMRIAKWETSEWIAAGDRVLDGGVNSGSVESNSDLGTGFYTLAVESRPTAVINTTDIELCNDGSNAEIEILLTGVAPYNFTYTINGGNSKNVTGINTQPYKLFISADDLFNINGNDDYVIKISDVWDATGSHGVSDFNKSVTVRINETPTPKVEGKTASNFNLAGDIYHSGTVTDPGHTYSWSINGGVITSSSTGSHQVTVKWGPVGTTNAWIELTETSASGCSTTNRLNVSLSEMPTPNVSGKNSVCIGDVEKYTTAVAVGHTFVWSVTGGSFIEQGTNEIEVTWNSVGTNRKVRVDETVGINTAFSEINVDVFVLPLDNYTITYDATVVESTTAQVTINGLPMGLNIQVFDANDNSAVSAVVPSNAGGDIVVDYNPTRTGEYYIVLTNGNGCNNTLTNKINITLIPPFTPVITEDNAHHCGGHSDSFTATANADYTYKWTILKCTVSDDTTNPVVVTWDNPTSPTTITVTVKLVVTHKVSGKTVEVTKDVTVTRTPETGEQYHVINNFS